LEVQSIIKKIISNKERIDLHLAILDETIVQGYRRLQSNIIRLKNTYLAESLASKAKLLLKAVE